MSVLSRGAALGLVIGLLGVTLNLFPFTYKLEENIGLGILFKIRGPRRPPPQVIIVSIDGQSARKLGLPADPGEWPHSLHARVIDNLAREGAVVIAFDIFFNKFQSREEDEIFAASMRKAHNVVLVEAIKREKIFLKDTNGLAAGELNIEKLLLPIPLLAEPAVALAPFPLPKVPVKVSQYWTFKTAAGDTPTLPIVAFQVYTLGVYDEFARLVQKYYPYQTGNFPQSREELMHSNGIVSSIRTLRDTFEGDRAGAKKMLEGMKDYVPSPAGMKRESLLVSLLNMYRSPASAYLNFYGSPRSIPTVPYYDVLQLDTKPDQINKHDFKGKAVFIGHSGSSQPEQVDGYHTVFSESNGMDISGVEIAATAFANLLENMPVRPLSSTEQYALIFVWGLVTGIVSLLSGGVVCFLSLTAMGAMYFMAVLGRFSAEGIWIPLVVPLFIQGPLAFYSAIACKYYDAYKDRQKIRKAFSYFLPDQVVDRISKDISEVRAGGRVVYGTCLATDAEQYTGLSEIMEPGELGNLMNKYYEAVFSPVKEHGGIVSNVIGDAMLAVWVTVQPDMTSGTRACRAALDINALMGDSSVDVRMLTRIGLHSGRMLLGSIGAINHYEYRPVGDIVNTAARLEGLNKYLGTKVLISQDVLEHLEGFVTREMGTFLLAGKKQPIVVHELICREEECTPAQEDLCNSFSEALRIFRRRSWTEASIKFNEVINRVGKDGPSLFYTRLCEQYKDMWDEEPWDGIICLDKK